MTRGTSGRIVIEVDPRLKRDLYVELARRGMTLKAWFVLEAAGLVEAGGQLPLFTGSAGLSQGATPPSDSSRLNAYPDPER